MSEVSSTSPYQAPVAVIWLKRDLRLQDHAPLAHAIELGLPILPVFCFEPSLIAHPDTSVRHLRFQYQSLLAMVDKLEEFGLPLYIFHREVVSLFEELVEICPDMVLLSHQETGVALTYERDLAVRAFCDQHCVEWKEFPHHGVVRGLTQRKAWDQMWFGLMNLPQCHVDLRQARSVVLADSWLEARLGPPLPSGTMRHDPAFQRGGTKHAKKLLLSFFEQRVQDYQRDISKPEASRRSCSRLSPYLAWGNVSVRQVYQTHRKYAAQSPFPQQMEAFVSRLWWHCHFIQKLESEPRLEFENLNSAYDAIWTAPDKAKIRAWKRGRTGFPLVDAAMRCVNATGYLNFRMRAMLISFLTHHLWQDWRTGVHHLAQQFLDYEPGIHYYQFQMQASTTGVNTIRVYNPIKQSQEHDPEGVFLRRWLPELADVPLSLLHTPWLMGEMEQVFYHCRIGEDYPAPIVSLKEAASHARRTLWEIKQSPQAKAESKKILARHVSARRAQQSRSRPSTPSRSPEQILRQDQAIAAVPVAVIRDKQLSMLDEWGEDDGISPFPTKDSVA